MSRKYKKILIIIIGGSIWGYVSLLGVILAAFYYIEFPLIFAFILFLPAYLVIPIYNLFAEYNLWRNLDFLGYGIHLIIYPLVGIMCAYFIIKIVSVAKKYFKKSKNSQK